MPLGLKLPVGANKQGGTAMLDGDDKNAQIIQTALSDCDNDNAFQQNLGLGSGMVFDVEDFTLRAQILRKVIEIFRVFESQDRFRLVTNTVKWEADANKGELTLTFDYLDLESDEVKPFQKVFTPKT